MIPKCLSLLQCILSPQRQTKSPTNRRVALMRLRVSALHSIHPCHRVMVTSLPSRLIRMYKEWKAVQSMWWCSSVTCAPTGVLTRSRWWSTLGTMATTQPAGTWAWLTYQRASCSPGTSLVSLFWKTSNPFSSTRFRFVPNVTQSFQLLATACSTVRKLTRQKGCIPCGGWSNQKCFHWARSVTGAQSAVHRLRRMSCDITSWKPSTCPCTTGRRAARPWCAFPATSARSSTPTTSRISSTCSASTPHRPVPTGPCQGPATPSAKGRLPSVSCPRTQASLATRSTTTSRTVSAECLGLLGCGAG